MANFFDIRARKAEAAVAAASSSKAVAPTDAGLQPWVEKYRPRSLEEVAAQEHTVTVLRRTLQSANLPHMLFYGPPGTGKTSTILALARQLFGQTLMRSRVLELNASDERGISIVREKVKDFARMRLSNADGLVSKDYPVPPYKLIILDEADSMTQDAQSALRRTMETYSRTTRFCLICNYATRIIDPLASRCSKFRFKLLNSSHAGARLQEISKLENLSIDSDAIQTLLRCSDGDLRKAITFLQSASRSGGKITSSTIEEIAGVVPGDTIETIISLLTKNVQFKRISALVEDIICEGWPAGQVIAQLYDRLILEGKMSAPALALFSETDKMLVDGSDEHLALLALVAGLTSL
ncbi:activator 1 41 kDa subunit [Piedraia hortae CBS 480.64]|uniref:Activator 1 41 kDa subunit n=1 Tax=Piedraia hortae CBS 480.64 TaxID=1314780 RepID=A0A6A7BV21_9PEZI|nr:activator 1 41 kDa subunit [Piedraia hortae CBS 480.64]